LWTPTSDYSSAVNANGRGFHVKSFYCPSRRGPGQLSTQEDVVPGDAAPPPEFSVPGTDPRFAGSNNPPGALGDYAVCVGDNSPGFEFNTITANGAFVLGNSTHSGTPPWTLSNITSYTRFASISDELSNTIFIGEKHVPLGKFGLESNGDGSIYNGDPTNFNAARIAGLKNTLARTPRDGFNTQFGSYHTGVCQFVFGDGSVHAVANTVAPETLRRLSVRNDGLPVSDY